MTCLADWIRRHQIAAFFVITFAISYGLGFSYDAVMNRGISLLMPVAFITVCSPALTGIIISAVINTQPKQGKRRIFWIVFITAWIVSALVFIANNLFINQAPFSIWMAVFVFISVAPVAFVIGMAYSRIPPVKQYLSSLIRLSGVWGWELLALTLIPALVLLSIGISKTLGKPASAAVSYSANGMALIGLILVKFLYQFFFFNATGEEVGWRGFAFPRMQSIVNPLVACLVLNLIWPLWHAPFWAAEGRPVFTLEYWLQTYLELLPGTVIMSWLYNRSKGSILVAGSIHAAANTAFAVFSNMNWWVYVWTSAAVALMMVLLDRMWRKLPQGHPAVHHAGKEEDL